MTITTATPLAIGRYRLSPTLVVLILAVAAGIVFRLMLPGDFECKGDERFTFHHLQPVLAGGPWPWLGMTMSIGGPNPGMSVWVFIGLGLVTGADMPPELARAVQLLNVAALLAFVGFVCLAMRGRAREPWLWAIALWAVNPLAVIYERKIWPPSVLPIFLVVMLSGWWYRRRWVGSFVFALAALVAGQIHPTGAFIGIAILAWTLVDDRRSVRPTGLLAGAIVGLVPALPWLAAYAGKGNSLHVWRPPLIRFYLRWLSEPFGFGADHTFGPVEFPRFLGWPEIAGHSIYLTAVVYAAAGAIALTLFYLGARRLWRTERVSLRWLFIGDTPAGLIVRAAFFGFGTILTVLTVRGGGLYPHYLIVIAPIMTLWVALLAAYGQGGEFGRAGRRLLAGLCLAEALIVVLMFSYIHSIGNIYGEFGPSWNWQQYRASLPVPVP